MLFTRPELATEPSIKEASVRLSILPIRLNIDQVGRREEGGWGVRRERRGKEEGWRVGRREGGGRVEVEGAMYIAHYIAST